MYALLTIVLLAGALCLVSAQGVAGRGIPNPSRNQTSVKGNRTNYDESGNKGSNGHSGTFEINNQCGCQDTRGPHVPEKLFDVFEECERFSKNMNETFIEMHHIGAVGSRSCLNGNLQECRKNDMIAVRCRASVQPSEACIQRIMNFLQNPCPTNGNRRESEKNHWK